MTKGGEKYYNGCVVKLGEIIAGTTESAAPAKDSGNFLRKRGKDNGQKSIIPFIGSSRFASPIAHASADIDLSDCVVWCYTSDVACLDTKRIGLVYK